MARLSFEEDPVYVKSASVVRVSQRTHNKKRFTFQIDLEWSDGNSSSSFRSYSELYKFHCGLLETFLEEAGQAKGSERTLPYLPGKKLFRASTRNLAEERLPQVQTYVSELLAMPQHISRSDRVLQFFRSNWSEDRLKSRKTSRSSMSPPPEDGSHGAEDSGEGAVSYSVRKNSVDLHIVQTTKSPPPRDVSGRAKVGQDQVSNGDQEEHKTQTRDDRISPQTADNNAECPD